MKWQLTGRLAFVLLSTMWLSLGLTHLKAMETADVCDIDLCNGGGCCKLDVSNFSCDDYCTECFTMGYSSGEECELDPQFTGYICYCNPR